jgi:histidine phosphotransferase ChpT
MTDQTLARPVVLEGLDLAALIASRVCHDVISPVGAINNGIEVLEDEDDAEMRKIAMDLVKKSAKQASAKLQFCRLAFGAAGSAGAEIDTGDAESVARGFAEGDKVVFSWEGPRLYLPKNKVKLLLNLVMIGLSAIPRGGSLGVRIEPGEASPSFRLTAQGMQARIPSGVPDLLRGFPAGHAVDAHSIQPYYTGLVAAAAGMAVDMTLDADTVTITATPGAA